MATLERAGTETIITAIAITSSTQHDAGRSLIFTSSAQTPPFLGKKGVVQTRAPIPKYLQNYTKLTHPYIHFDHQDTHHNNSFALPQTILGSSFSGQRAGGFHLMADRVSSQRSKWAVGELAAAPLALPLPLTCRREDVKLEHCCRSYHFNLDLRKDELSCCYSILNAYSGQCCLWHFGSRSDVSTARPPHPCHFTALAVSSLLKCIRGMQIVSLNRHGTVTDGEDAS